MKKERQMTSLLGTPISRRTFLKIVGAAGVSMAAPSLVRTGLSSSRANAVSRAASIGYSHEAGFYEALDEATVKCLLCPHECLLRNGQRGFCRVREPDAGRLYSMVYGMVAAAHVDPIEKKPLYHVLPGSSIYSIATAGCNLRCKFCQNWQLSQNPPEATRNRAMSPAAIIAAARANGCGSIAFTYTEPTVFYEYMSDIAAMAEDAGIKTVSVTAGYINPEPLRRLCGRLTAANVDLKAFDDEYLRKICSERLEPLLTSLEIMREEGVWVEITNLIVPTLNDDMGMIGEMCQWIRNTLGQETPLHFSRFWPMYKLTHLPPTPIETLLTARETAVKQGLKHVYVGNVRGQEGSQTLCPGCGKAVIKRAGYTILESRLSGGRCGHCGCAIAGVWG